MAHDVWHGQSNGSVIYLAELAKVPARKDALLKEADSTHPVHIHHRFEVPVDRLFRAWRDPYELANWAWGSLGHSATADVDFRVGGAFRVTTKRPDGETWSISGLYTDIQPNHRIAHTLVWHAPMGYDPVPEHVEVVFHEDGTGSSIDFTHAGVPDGESAATHAQGWRNTFETLGAYLMHA